MTGWMAWLGAALLVLILAVVNKRVKRSGPLGKAADGLRQLVLKQREGRSTPEDLPLWEASLDRLAAYPSEYNELNAELRFLDAFAQFLGTHYPSDERIPSLQAAGSYRKDTIWGVKIHREDRESRNDRS